MNIPILSQQERQVVGENKLGSSLAGNLMLAALGESSERYDSGKASQLIHYLVAREDEPDKQPFRDPFYWAGFQVTGW